MVFVRPKDATLTLVPGKQTDTTHENNDHPLAVAGWVILNSIDFFFSVVTRYVIIFLSKEISMACTLYKKCIGHIRHELACDSIIT